MRNSSANLRLISFRTPFGVWESMKEIPIFDLHTLQPHVDLAGVSSFPLIRSPWIR